MRIRLTNLDRVKGHFLLNLHDEDEDEVPQLRELRPRQSVELHATQKATLSVFGMTKVRIQAVPRKPASKTRARRPG